MRAPPAAATAYGDFVRRDVAYGAFAPASQVYGAFAMPGERAVDRGFSALGQGEHNHAGADQGQGAEVHRPPAVRRRRNAR